MQDIRDQLFRGICHRKFRAVLLTERDGILSGVADAVKIAQKLGVTWTSGCAEGDRATAGEAFAQLTAPPKEIAMAEEQIIGALSKTSGIATAANQAVRLADGKIDIVSGSWKKMPFCMKDAVRRAIVTGGAAFRICDPPMIYMDKNFVTMLGSVKAALEAAAGLNATKIVQIRGILEPVREETLEALAGGADILMVDTGNLSDADVCLKVVAEKNCRGKVKVAFAGSVRLQDIPMLAARGIDILCIGREIVDAPLLDMKLNVLEEV